MQSMCCEFAPQSLHDRASFMNVSSVNASVMFVLTCFVSYCAQILKMGILAVIFTVFYSCLNGFFCFSPSCLPPSSI